MPEAASAGGSEEGRNEGASLRYDTGERDCSPSGFIPTPAVSATDATPTAWSAPGQADHDGETVESSRSHLTGESMV